MNYYLLCPRFHLAPDYPITFPNYPAYCIYRLTDF